jgi:hypothetical protein
MSEQRCWDCAHGKRYGRGERTGNPRDGFFFIECMYPVPFWVTSADHATNAHCAFYQGVDCPCFKPREEPA